MNKTLFGIIGFFVIQSSLAVAGASGSITVPVSGIRNNEGVVRCGLFSSAATFRRPGAQVKGSIAKISGGRATCSFANVAPGTYAVAVFHAENNEATIQTGSFGKPTEGYGFSNNAGGSFGPPSFDEAALSFDGSKASWPVHLNY